MSFLRENRIPLVIVFSGLIIATSLYFALKPKEDNNSLKVSQNSQKTETNITSTPTKEVSVPTTASIPTENQLQL